MQTAVATASKEEHDDGGDREGKGVEQGGVEQEDHNVLDYGIWFMFCQVRSNGMRSIRILMPPIWIIIHFTFV